MQGAIACVCGSDLCPYRVKYRHYAASIVGSTITPQARAATIKLLPRQTSSYNQ